MNGWTDLLVSLIASFLLLGVIVRLAPRMGWLDHPSERKTHAQPTPHLGGIGMLGGFMLAATVLGSGWTPSIWVGLVLLTLLGHVDDFRPMKAVLRLLIQIGIVGTAVMLEGLEIRELRGFFGPGSVSLGTAGLPFTVLCVLALVNALNLLDGLDGLVGLMSLVALASIGWIGHLFGLDPGPELTFLAGCLVAFLIYNLRYPGHPRADLFMGDGGAYFLGFAIAMMLLNLEARGPGVPSAVFAWPVLVPVALMASTFIQRLIRGIHPMQADRLHLHHVLIDQRRWSVDRVVMVYAGLVLLLGILGPYLAHRGWPLSASWSRLVMVLPLFLLLILGMLGSRCQGCRKDCRFCDKGPPKGRGDGP